MKWKSLKLLEASSGRRSSSESGLCATPASLTEIVSKVGSILPLDSINKGFGIIVCNFFKLSLDFIIKDVLDCLF